MQQREPEPSGRPAEAAAIPPEAQVLGLARLARIAFAQGDFGALVQALLARLAADPGDAAAMMDLATILHSQGDAAGAGRLRDQAIALRRSFATVHGDGRGLRLLAFSIAGGFMANTPVDFLLAGSDAVLWQTYIDAASPALGPLPPHDAAILAIGEAPEHRAALERFGALAAAYPGRILNGDARRIAALTRDGVSAMLQGIPGLLCPRTLRLPRAALDGIARGADLPEALAWPLLLRPAGSHAGEGLTLLAGPADLARALDATGVDTGAESGAETFFLVPFIDYHRPDGLFGKARVVFVGGRPHPVHFALSQSPIVHYLSAGMAESAEKRAAEAAWFADFDTVFARRHAAALAEMQARIGLDYWGIDCAETADGRLLVFEADTALIVHDMDDPGLFAYKEAPMRRIFAAFQALAASAAAGG